MDKAQNASHSNSVKKFPIYPLQESLVLGVVLIGLICFSSFTLYESASSVYTKQIHQGLIELTRAVGSLVDGDLQEKFIDTSQEKTPEYIEAVKPFKKILADLKNIRYIYTTRLVGDKIYFVLDGAPYGDADNDGVEDHSSIMDVYTDPDPALIRALKQNVSTSSNQPYKDKWGTFISGYTPIRNSQGNQVGVLGIDIKADNFEKEVERLKKSAISGLFLPIATSIFISISFYFLRRSALKAQKHRQELEARLLQSQKMETVGTLAGGIAHDLNNQLTPLAGYADLLIKEVNPDDPRYPVFVEINKAAIRCSDVVQSLVNFSKRSPKQKAIFNPCLIVDELKNIFSKFLPATISVKIFKGPDVLPILGNRTDLHTVMINLLANARDAMPQGGVIEIRIRSIDLSVDKRIVPPGFLCGPYVAISVSDTGSGMSPEVKSKIFEPFFTTKTKDRGTGLGLAMVFSIIKDHEGWIHVDSRVGKGTVFTIYLPARAGVVETDTRTQTQNLVKGSGTILLADDEESLRKMGELFLKRLGYQVILASDGQELVDIYQARNNEIALVLMDMTMPKLTGRQMLAKLLEINPKAKIVLVSGYTDEGSVQDFINQGATSFVQKPYTIMVLAQAIHKAISKS